MTTLCFYRMTHDTGFAPNPFHGDCTVAHCTPNRMRASLRKGDYIVGIEGVGLRRLRKKKRRQNHSSSDDLCIIYFMKIDEVLPLKHYFKHPRSAKKKYKPNGSCVERVGDNVYWFDGKWQWDPGHAHDDDYNIKKDTGGNPDGNPVFISSCFSYFGDMGILLPEDLQEHVPRRRGMKYAYNATDFLVGKLEELGSRCGKGLVGHPIEPPPDLILNLSGTPAGCK